MLVRCKHIPPAEGVAKENPPRPSFAKGGSHVSKIKCLLEGFPLWQRGCEGGLRLLRHSPKVTGAKRCQGFSVLEILIAFVVMALVVGSLLQLFGTSMRNVVLADEYSFAVQIAESRMQAVGAEIPVEPGSVTGAEEGTGYSWAVNMEPVELDEEQDDFSLSIQPFQVNVIVSWDSAGKRREFVLSSLRFGEQI